MARLYALIANGGKLVRPHLALQVEEGGGTPHSPPRVVHTLPRAGAAVGRAQPDLPRGRAGRALAGDALVDRNLDQRLRRLPDPDRRQDRHGAEGPEHRPEGPVLVVRLRAGRQHDAARARGLRADRERRLRRRRGRARRAAGLQAVLQEAAQPPGHWRRRDDRGRRHPRARTALASHRGGRGRLGDPPARLAAASERSPRCSPSGSGRSTASPPTTSRATRTTSSSARASTRRSASRARSRCCSSTRSSTAATCGAIYIGTTGVMLLVLLAGTVSRALEALARHRLLPLPAVRVREAPVRPLPRRLPGRPGQADRRDPDRARGDRPRLRADPARLRAARHRHRDGLHRPRWPRCSSWQACAGRTWPCSASGRSS